MTGIHFSKEFAECMVRRLTAREKFVEEESLRQCIRPLWAVLSTGQDYRAVQDPVSA